MSAQYALLGFLKETPNYGYELKKMYDNYFGADKEILPGQVYSTLARLKRDEKIAEVIDDEVSGGPERVKYKITPLGELALRTWLNTPEAPSPQLKATLYMKTVLAIIESGDAAPFLDNQRRAHIQRMRELTKQRRETNLANKLLIDHAIFHLEADLRWIDLTSSRLTTLKEELSL
ncbi:MAG: PadR family transcriptional regulator [Micrococcaceae bacterium]